jgi:hypothetical protein
MKKESHKSIVSDKAVRHVRVLIFKEIQTTKH